MKTQTKDYSLRPYILLTLSHAEKRTIDIKLLMERVRKCFDCRSVIIAKEKHENGGFHYHVGIFNSNASRYTAIKKLREAFPEFDGAQIDVKFHKESMGNRL